MFNIVVIKIFNLNEFDLVLCLKNNIAHIAPNEPKNKLRVIRKCSLIRLFPLIAFFLSIPYITKTIKLYIIIIFICKVILNI